jgi:hypothetical protein
LSLAEAIRRRLEVSIEASDPRIRRLQSLVALAVTLVEASTGCRFDKHPAAAETLRRAVSIMLENMGARADAKFEEDDL